MILIHCLKTAFIWPKHCPNLKYLTLQQCKKWITWLKFMVTSQIYVRALLSNVISSFCSINPWKSKKVKNNTSSWYQQKNKKSGRFYLLWTLLVDMSLVYFGLFWEYGPLTHLSNFWFQLTVKVSLMAFSAHRNVVPFSLFPWTTLYCSRLQHLDRNTI